MKILTRPVIVLEIVYSPELAEFFNWMKHHAKIAYHDDNDKMNEDIYDLDETGAMINDEAVDIDAETDKIYDQVEKMARRKKTCYVQLVTM